VTGVQTCALPIWRKYRAKKRRRTAVKKVLVRIPGVRPLNDRFGWFVAPS